MNNKLNDENYKLEKATANSWKCIPFSTSKKIECNIVLTKEEFNIISKGYIPISMEDHWFMYCDQDSINYFRSWTGKQIFKGYYKIEDNSYIIYLLKTIDNNDSDDNNVINDFNNLIKNHCKYRR